MSIVSFLIYVLLLGCSLEEDEVCKLEEFRQQSKDLVLAGHVVATHQVQFNLECMLHCRENSNCQSYNYQYDEKIKDKVCEINNLTLSMCLVKQTQRKGFVVFENVKHQTYGSKDIPGMSCADLQYCGQKSGEYWIMQEGKKLKIYCNRTMLNVALGKPTIQSSKFAIATPSSKAVDGDKTQLLYGSCTHTHKEFSPWWRVDLEKLYFVRQVNITNRLDSNVYRRLSNFEVRIGNSLDDNGNSNPPCGGKYSVGNGETRAIFCEPPILGKYVNIVIPGRKEYLTLCEVEVYP